MPSTWVAVVDGRSSILFATLAGVSIGLVTGGRTPLAGRAMRDARGCGSSCARVPAVAARHPAHRDRRAGLRDPARVRDPVPARAARSSRSARARCFVLAGGARRRHAVRAGVLDALPFWSTPRRADCVGRCIGWHYPFPVWIAFVVAGLGVARAGILRTARAAVDAGRGRRARGGRATAWMPRPAPTRRPSDVSYSGRGLDRRRRTRAGLLEVIGSGGFALAVIGAVPAAVPDRARLGRAAAARRRRDAAHRLHRAARGLGDRRHGGARRPGRPARLPRPRAVLAADASGRSSAARRGRCSSAAARSSGSSIRDSRVAVTTAGALRPTAASIGWMR